MNTKKNVPPEVVVLKNGNVVDEVRYCEVPFQRNALFPLNTDVLNVG